MAQAKLRELSAEAEAQSDGHTPRLLCGHFSVSGALWGSERGVMLGRDVAVDLEALARWRLGLCRAGAYSPPPEPDG